MKKIENALKKYVGKIFLPKERIQFLTALRRLIIVPFFFITLQCFSQIELSICAGSNLLTCNNPSSTICATATPKNGDGELICYWQYSTDNSAYHSFNNYISYTFTTSITVNKPGYYRLDDTYDVSNVIYIADGKTPVITSGGSSSICAGESVTLTSTGGNSYSWSTGETTKSITVYTPGSYSVSVVTDGDCTFTSVPYEVTSSGGIPTITAPADLTLNNDPGICGAGSVNLGTPITTDNCSFYAAINDAPAIFPVGSTIVNWSIGDASMGIHSQQVVTVNDNEKPTITPPPDIVANNNPGSCGVNMIDLGTPVTADNCGVLAVYNNAPAVFPVGTTTVTWTVQDLHGNSATAQQFVTINDNEKPILFAPPDINMEDQQVCDANMVNIGVPTTFGDNCGSTDPPTITNDAPAVFPTGTTLVTWTATDASGNQTTAIQHVTVTDHQKPAIYGRTEFCVNWAAQLSSDIPGGTWSIDNPSVATINEYGQVYTVSGGSAVVSYTITTGSCTRTGKATIHVNTPPLVDYIVGNTNVCVGSVVPLTDPSPGGEWSSTNTSVATVDPLGVVTILNTGTTFIIYKITNENGCSASASTWFNVNPSVKGTTIKGNKIICVGASSTLSNLYPGGNWSSSNPAVASITPDGIVTGITAGTSSIIYSMSGCVSSISATVTVKPAASVDAITGPDFVSPGSFITLTDQPAGGVWTNTNVNIATVDQSGILNGLAPGKSTVTYKIFNTYGCSASATKQVTVYKKMAVSITVGKITCNNATTTLKINASGGSGSYQYSINDGAFQNTNSFTISAGGNNIHIEDVAGDQVFDTSFTVLQPDPVSLSLTTVTSPTNNSANGSFTVTGAGGTAPYKYSVNGKAYQASNLFDKLKAGMYYVSVKDANNCSVSAPVTIVLSAAPVKGVASAITPVEKNSGTGSELSLLFTATAMQQNYASVKSNANHTLWGGEIGYTHMFSKQFGFTGVLHLGSKLSSEISSNQILTLAGLTYYPMKNIYSSQYFNISFHALAGYSSPEALNGNLKYRTGGGFSYDLGSALDVKLSRNINLRMIQIDYLSSGKNGGGLKNISLSTGLSFNLSK